MNFHDFAFLRSENNINVQPQFGGNFDNPIYQLAVLGSYKGDATFVHI